jgi:hypothetical protein
MVHIRLPFAYCTSPLGLEGLYHCLATSCVVKRCRRTLTVNAISTPPHLGCYMKATRRGFRASTLDAMVVPNLYFSHGPISITWAREREHRCDNHWEVSNGPSTRGTPFCPNYLRRHVLFGLS